MLIYIFLKNTEIAYEEFKLLCEERKKGGTGEINHAIWKQKRVVIKKVNTRANPAMCSKNFVHEVSNNHNIIENFNIINSKMNFQYRLHDECNTSDNVIRLLGFTKGIHYISLDFQYLNIN